MTTKKIPTTRPSLPRLAAIVAFVAACCAALMTGCDSPAATSTNNHWEPSVWRDHVTGCEYLSPRDGKAITPRMGRDGKQVCAALMVGAK